MHISLTGAHNTRDLGGITTADGRILKQHRLLRSGALHSVTPEDCEVLLGIGLRKVIDLRTPAESAQRPDIVIPGVEYISNPLLGDSAIGVTREKSVPELVAEMAKAGEGFDSDEYMQSIYRKIAQSEQCAAQLRGFFAQLLNTPEGAVLWHCSAGKDRVGVSTALLLSALGVPREVVMQDYLLTNQYVSQDIDELVVKLTAKLGPVPQLRELITVLFSVREGYLGSVFSEIDSSFGGMESYLTNRIGLSEEDRNQLRKLYLEP